MKQKILFILHLPPPVHGAAMMGKYIHDSKIVNETFDCHYINLSTAKELTDIGKVGIKKLFRFISLLVDIHRSVKTLRPKLVYVTPNACGGAFYKDFIVVEMLKNMGCKIVVHYHNKGVATRQDRKFDNLLYNKFFKNIKVILLSEKLYDDVKKYVKRDDVMFCPNGIPENCYNSTKNKNKDNTIPRILFLSNLLESKGVIVLLDALKILKDKGYSFICNFVGGETSEIDSERFKNEVEKRHLNNMALYIGRKYGTDKDAVFEQSDVFVFPTFYYNETFGLVNLEAMEHKLPIVTTDEGGITDVVKDGKNGLISEKKNPDSLAKCIEVLITDKNLCEKMGEEGYRMFKRDYTLSAFERHFTDCVNKCLTGGG